MTEDASIEAARNGRLVVRGTVTFTTVPRLYEQSRSLFRGDADMVVDLRGVERADSAGLALLVEWMREARRNERSVRFVNMPHQMLAIARVSSLDQVLPLSRD